MTRSSRSLSARWICFLLVFLGTVPQSRATPPPMPTYDGCVVGGRVRIVTGLKRVVDPKGKKEIDLRPFSGKRIRFKGYLLKEPTLVMVASAPTVVSACRGPQELPESGLSIPDALDRSKEIPASKSEPPGDALAAVVEAVDPPLMSGEIEGNALLSHRFRTVKTIHGRWPDTFVIHYRASIEANERAILAGEVMILIPKRDKRDKTFSAGKFLHDTPELRKRVASGR